jgi:orotidine-5'-phosphate decarboxylase
VNHYAKLAMDAKIKGVVCAVSEVKDIKKSINNKDFITVCPGIRTSVLQRHDQRRVATIAQAKEAGADYVVIGRLITTANNPLATYQKLKREF